MSDFSEIESQLLVLNESKKQPKKSVLEYEKGLISFGLSYTTLENSSLEIDFEENCIGKELIHSQHFKPHFQRNPLGSEILAEEAEIAKNADSLLNSLRLEPLRNRNLKENLQPLGDALINRISNLYIDESYDLMTSNNICSNPVFNELTGRFVGRKDAFVDPSFKSFQLDHQLKADGGVVSLKKKEKPKALLRKLKYLTKLDIEEEIDRSVVSKLEELKKFEKQESLDEKIKNESLLHLGESLDWAFSMTNEYLSNAKFTGHRKNVISDAMEKRKQKKNQKLTDDEKEKKMAKIHDFLKKFSPENDSTQIEEDLASSSLQKAAEEEPKITKDDDEAREEKKFQSFEIRVVNTSRTKLNNTNYKWAVADETNLENFYHILPKEKFALHYPFELDDFQKRAVLNLEKGQSVFVAAHTSAGKTAVAEYAIALSQKHKTRTIYTSPIKALSNQKYREFLQKFKDVGIITGDVSIKPEAGCLIMTTEILRSMIYRDADLLRDVEWVIFDEVHYVNNSERGVVWEETIIMLPERIGIVMLSATVPNSMDFANWVGRTKGRTIYVQYTSKRPVPLEHKLYLMDDFYLIKEKENPFLVNDYRQIPKLINEKNKKKKNEYEEKRSEANSMKKQKGLWKYKGSGHGGQSKPGSYYTSAPRDKNSSMPPDQKALKDLITICNKEKLLPCVIFCFAKKRITTLSRCLHRKSLCTAEETGRIKAFFLNALKKLKEVDRKLPQLVELQKMLENGYAVHHSDLLPLAKEIVEILFSEGLVKVLFATETFAMGVNMPAKSVIFEGLKKSDGINFRYLKSVIKIDDQGEYTQMSGRAGRRGLDEKGNVILFISDLSRLPPPEEMRAMIDHKGESLESKFRITYGIVLNLLKSQEIDALEMIKRSYSENSRYANFPDNVIKLKDLTIKREIIKVNCSNGCDIPGYVKTLKKLKDANYDFFKDRTNEINTPCFLAILDNKGSVHFVLLLKFLGKNDTRKERRNWRCLSTYKFSEKQQTLVVMDPLDKEEAIEDRSTKIFNINYKIFDISPESVLEVMQDNNIPFRNTSFTKIEGEMKMLGEIGEYVWERGENFNLESLYKQQSKNKNPLKAYKFSKGPVELLQERTELMKLLTTSQCHDCKMKDEHFKRLSEISEIDAEIEKVHKVIDDSNMSLKAVFEGHVEVLKKLGYVDEDSISQMKARVARELSDADIYLCEVIMENLLKGLEPAEIAALLSAFVNQYKCKGDSYNEGQFDSLEENLNYAIESTITLARKIATLEQETGILNEHVDDFVSNKLNFSLVNVVYQWAKEKDFIEICELTDAPEGAIVKTIQRLENLLKNVKSATKYMGDDTLSKALDKTISLIRRDIIFSNSLYLE